MMGMIVEFSNPRDLSRSRLLGDARTTASQVVGYGQMAVSAVGTASGAAAAAVAAGSQSGLLAAAAGLSTNPFTLAIGAGLAVAALLMTIFHGANPLEGYDVDHDIQPAWMAMYKIWKAVSGEDVTHGATCCPIPSGIKNFGVSTYPNVPYGPEGDMTVDIDAAIQAGQTIMAQAQSQAKLPQTLKDQFFTNNGVMKWLNEVKQARANAPVGQQITQALAPVIGAPATSFLSSLPSWVWLAIGGVAIYAIAS